MCCRMRNAIRVIWIPALIMYFYVTLFFYIDIEGRRGKNGALKMVMQDYAENENMWADKPPDFSNTLVHR